MQEKLIAELVELVSRQQYPMNPLHPESLKDSERVVRLVLSRIEAEQGEKLRETGKTYIIKLFHEKLAHTESFEYCVYDPSCGGKWCGSHSTEQIARTDKSEILSHQEVLEKRVWGVTPYNAICRFMEWQSKGYDNSFLKGPTPDKAVEPMAVLADRKGVYIHRIIFLRPNEWVINFDGTKENHIEDIRALYTPVIAPTYALAESKARAYLEALPDKESK